MDEIYVINGNKKRCLDICVNPSNLASFNLDQASVCHGNPTPAQGEHANLWLIPLLTLNSANHLHGVIAMEIKGTLKMMLPCGVTRWCY